MPKKLTPTSTASDMLPVSVLEKGTSIENKEYGVLFNSF
jgi:hypothetical protein